MVFRRLPARPKYPVRLDFPASSVGTELRIWTGRPLAQVTTAVLSSAEWRGELLRGVYVAEVAAAGLRHGFQVSGAGPVEEVVTRTGSAVIVPDGSELFTLSVVASNPAAAISVMDYQFIRIFSETGELHEREMPGAYKIRVGFGRDITMISDDVLLLDRDTVLSGPDPGRMLASPAPVPGAASTHEFHVAPFEKAADRRGVFSGPSAGRSMISLLARYWTEPGDPATAAVGSAPPPPHPLQGMQLVDVAGQPLADFSQENRVLGNAGIDRAAVWEQEVPPGAYFLRQALAGGRQYEGAVIASPDWVTQVAIQRATPTDAPGGGAADRMAVSDVAVFMRRAGVRRTPDQDATVEGARMALTQGRNLFADGRGAQLAELLLAEFADPIAGIIGGHLLLQAMDEAQADPVRTEQFESAVINLRSLVGPDHPDVEALSLRCTNVSLRTTRPFMAPPMFRHSWQLITAASYQRPELVPAELWRRVHASLALGAFFVWATDEPTRTAHADQLSRWISQYADSGAVSAAAAEGARETTPLPQAAREGAHRLQVPADAATALWREQQNSQQDEARD